MSKEQLYLLMSLDTLYFLNSDISYKISQLGSDPAHLSLLKEQSLIEDLIRNKLNNITK